MSWQGLLKMALVPIATAMLTTIGILATGAFGYWNADRSQDIQMVNIALSILGGENKETSVQGRRFALLLLEKYARVDIIDDDFEPWAKSGTLPKDIFVAPSASSSKAGRFSERDLKNILKLNPELPNMQPKNPQPIWPQAYDLGKFEKNNEKFGELLKKLKEEAEKQK